LGRDELAVDVELVRRHGAKSTTILSRANRCKVCATYVASTFRRTGAGDVEKLVCCCRCAGPR
jgi:hypothetical protein